MPRYFVSAKLTKEGLISLRTDGFAARIEANRQAWESVGGTIEVWYYGASTDEFDIYAIVNAATSDVVYALSSSAIASGTSVVCKAVELRTGEEADAAVALASG